MLMPYNVLQLIRFIEVLHVLGQVNHIIDWILFVHVLKVNPASGLDLIEHVFLDSSISHDLGILEDCSDDFLIILKAFLSKCNIDGESRNAVELMIGVGAEL